MPVIVTRGGASLKALGFAGAGKPLAPTIGTPTRTSASISVLFTPGYNGGAPVTSYTITSTPGNYIFSGASSPIAATGMTLGTDYTFKVYATNAYGNSPESASSTSIKYASVPLTPTIGTATIISTTSVNVTFTAGANGGEPITSYTAVSTPGSITGTVNQAGSGTVSVTGLASGVAYTFKVYATNTLGNGPLSTASNSVTPDLPTYNISSNLSGMVGGDIMSEGETASFYIDTNETVTATTLYWSVSGTGITAADFVSGSLTGNVSILPASRATVSMTTTNDLTTEGQETFTLRFYTNAGRTTLLTDAVIGGYVIGNEKTVNVTDSSTVGFSINPSVLSVNEGGSVTFTVTRTDGASSTAYWGVQGVSGSITTGDFSATQGSVPISSGTGTFSVTVTSDQVTEGAESFRVGIWVESLKLTLLAISATVTINDTSAYPAYGTYQGSFCSGYNLYYIYADGSGGTYNSLAESNSVTCGYVAPTVPGISISQTLYYQSFPPYTNTKGTTIVINNGSSISGVSYSVTTTAGLQRNVYFNQSESGTLLVGAGTYITYYGPHDATTAYISISKSGYTSVNYGVGVAANNNYSPYSIYQGFLQESGYAYSAALAYAVYQYYAGSGTFYVTHDPGVIRYQLYRAPEYGGLAFWCSHCILNAIDPSSQQFRDAFGSASETFTGPKTSYNPGTGFNMFSDRP